MNSESCCQCNPQQQKYFAYCSDFRVLLFLPDLCSISKKHTWSSFSPPFWKNDNRFIQIKHRDRGLWVSKQYGTMVHSFCIMRCQLLKTLHVLFVRQVLPWNFNCVIPFISLCRQCLMVSQWMQQVCIGNPQSFIGILSPIVDIVSINVHWLGKGDKCVIKADKKSQGNFEEIEWSSYLILVSGNHGTQHPWRGASGSLLIEICLCYAPLPLM